MGKKYPFLIQSWQNKWENLSTYFKYPPEIRKVIYTTNSIESVHHQFRKLTKTKGAFPNDNSLLKLPFMGIKNTEKKWTMPVWNWSLTISQLAIFFEGKLDNELKLSLRLGLIDLLNKDQKLLNIKKELVTLR